MNAIIVIIDIMIKNILYIQNGLKQEIIIIVTHIPMV